MVDWQCCPGQRLHKGTAASSQWAWEWAWKHLPHVTNGPQFTCLAKKKLGPTCGGHRLFVVILTSSDRKLYFLIIPFVWLCIVDSFLLSTGFPKPIYCLFLLVCLLKVKLIFLYGSQSFPTWLDGRTIQSIWNVLHTHQKMALTLS